MSRIMRMRAFIGRAQAIEHRVLYNSVRVVTVATFSMSIQRIAAPQSSPAFNKISIDNVVRFCAGLLIDRRNRHTHGQVEVRRDIFYVTRCVANHGKCAMTLVASFLNSRGTPGLW